VEVEVRESGPATLVSPRGRLDGTTVRAFQEYLTGAMAGEGKVVIIDLSGLEYISSAGLRAVLSGSKTLQNRQGRLLLSGLGGMVEEVFKMAGFYDLLPIFPSEKEALESI
jgi:anti-anti-sigma factor